MLNPFFDICGQFSEEEARTLQAGLGRHLGQFTVTTWREKLVHSGAGIDVAVDAQPGTAGRTAGTDEPCGGSASRS